MDSLPSLDGILCVTGLETLGFIAMQEAIEKIVHARPVTHSPTQVKMATKDTL